MARMYPYCRTDRELEDAIPEESDGWRGERILYKFLRDHAPSSWTVIYNTTFMHEGTRHQLDFLLMVPGKGILNLDAKGYGYSQSEGEIFRYNTRTRRGERARIYDTAQAAIMTFDRHVRAYVSKGNPWGNFDYMIIFATTEVVLKPGIDEAFAFSLLDAAGHEESFARRFEQQVERLLDSHGNGGLFSRYSEAILKYLTPSCIPVAESRQFLDWDQCSEDELSLEQKKIFAKMPKYAHIKGGAGTGKTIVALLLAKKLAAQGKQVLYVCFNNELAKSLRRKNKESRVSVTSFYSIGNVFGVDYKRIYGSGINCEEVEKARGRDFLDRCLEEKLDLLKGKAFDVLIVDEAQDLSHDNLLLLFSFFKAPYERQAFLFSDAEQSIFCYENTPSGWDYDEKALFPNEEVFQFTLSMNYRNMKPIHESFKAYEDGSIATCWDDDNRNSPKEFFPVTSVTFQQMRQIISSLLAGTNSASEIAVLSTDKGFLEQVNNFPSLDGGADVRFTQDVKTWEDPLKKQVLKTTVQKFKGLEAGIVFFHEKEGQLDESKMEKLRYVGKSRAKYRLYIVQG